MNLFKPENEFKVGWCPICNQGWQVIIMDADTGKLYVPPYEKIAKEGWEQYLITEVQENSSM